ncbi:MAG: hypothetical protein AUK48_05105 [Oscillatoriales cyanobacterium CG2_30_44_21]|nr:MAG: hypothetical protein AUK48_05105 [Oscillatoriales cyanobacterium CG2_30_44_21]
MRPFRRRGMGVLVPIPAWLTNALAIAILIQIKPTYKSVTTMFFIFFVAIAMYRLTLGSF